MSELLFELDPPTNASSLEMHGISFEEAKTVFSDNFARVITDPEHSEREERFVLLGTSIESNLLVVSYCIRDEQYVRLILARKADRREQQTYENFRYAW